MSRTQMGALLLYCLWVLLPGLSLVRAECCYDVALEAQRTHAWVNVTAFSSRHTTINQSMEDVQLTFQSIVQVLDPPRHCLLLPMHSLVPRIGYRPAYSCHAEALPAFHAEFKTTPFVPGAGGYRSALVSLSIEDEYCHYRPAACFAYPPVPIRRLQDRLVHLGALGSVRAILFWPILAGLLAMVLGSSLIAYRQQQRRRQKHLRHLQKLEDEHTPKADRTSWRRPASHVPRRSLPPERTESNEGRRSAGVPVRDVPWEAQSALMKSVSTRHHYKNNFLDRRATLFKRSYDQLNKQLQEDTRKRPRPTTFHAADQLHGQECLQTPNRAARPSSTAAMPMADGERIASTNLDDLALPILMPGFAVDAKPTVPPKDPPKRIVERKSLTPKPIQRITTPVRTVTKQTSVSRHHDPAVELMRAKQARTLRPKQRPSTMFAVASSSSPVGVNRPTTALSGRVTQQRS